MGHPEFVLSGQRRLGQGPRDSEDEGPHPLEADSLRICAALRGGGERPGGVVPLRALGHLPHGVTPVALCVGHDGRARLLHRAERRRAAAPVVCPVPRVQGQLGRRCSGVQEGRRLVESVPRGMLQSGLGPCAEDLRGLSGPRGMLPPRPALGGRGPGEGSHTLLPDGGPHLALLEIGPGEQLRRRPHELSVVGGSREHGAGREVLRDSGAALQGSRPLPEGGLAEAGARALLLREVVRRLAEGGRGLVRGQRS
mmetsp:Transcript_67008/g.187318  ORF Transcript_67008/g.187318 Transcript_67008/m.187318 type:complete len:254 (+) Transcript_67008:2651-3412(+)